MEISYMKLKISKSKQIEQYESRINKLEEENRLLKNSLSFKDRKITKSDLENLQKILPSGVYLCQKQVYKYGTYEKKPVYERIF